MLTCKTYIFKLTSGQLAQAGTIDKLWAWQHRLICRRCRAFTVNDEKLDDILAAYRTTLTEATGADKETPTGESFR